MNQRGPFPRILLIAPGLVALAFLAVLLGGAAAGVKFPMFSGPAIAALLVLSMLVALVLQGAALLTALPRLVTSAKDRTLANWLSTAFAVACVVPTIAGVIEVDVFIASAGR